jgi:outer membrane lipoprotein-sorting protein
MIRRLVISAAALAVCGCAARMPARPSGTATPDPTAVAAFAQATRQCAGLKTITAELRLSGRAGGEKLRGTLHTGLAAPASLRFEAIAPFGQPFFILAGRGNQATLLLPRDRRVLLDAPVPDLLERLTGLKLAADDLRLLLSGCLVEQAAPTEGRTFANGWQAVSVGAGTSAYVRTVNGAPAVVAADDGNWRVDYANHRNGWPRQVRIRSVSGDVDMTAAVEQLEINTDIDDQAFVVAVPPGTDPMTLDHLRSVAPLRGSQ